MKLNISQELVDNFILACKFMNLDSKKILTAKALRVEVEHTKDPMIYNIISKHKKIEHRYESISLEDLHKTIYKIVRKSTK